MPTISGITKDASGTPCEALVVAYRRSDMSIAGMVFSDASTGAYSITTADTSPHIVHRYFGALGDVNFSSLKIAAHFAGANNSTSFPLVVGGITLAPSGDAKISSDHTLFGANMAKFDGTGDYLTASANTPFNHGTGDFTMRTKLWLNSVASYAPIVECRAAASFSSYVFGIYNTGGLKLDFVYGASRLTSASTVPTGQIVDIEIARSSGTVMMFIDGVKDANTATVTAAIDSTQASPLIGTNVDGNYLNGYLGEFQFFNKCLHTATFTPPAATFIDYLIGAPTENAQIFDYVTPV